MVAHMRERVNNWQRCCTDFVESHPRTGWYFAIIGALNVILNLIDLFK